jgi:glutamate synthase domain-containing protein 3
MAGSVEVVKRIADAPALAARKRFGRYKREADKATRKAEVKESEALRQIAEALRNYEFRLDVSKNPLEDDYLDNSVGAIWYAELSKIARKIRYTSEDIEMFSFMLGEHHYEEMDRIGIFLSAFINNGADSHYVIHTRHLDSAPEYIGCHNEGKNIIIHGDAGDGLGQKMKNGSIVVLGNADGSAGYSMRGGSITVEGDAGSWVGQRLIGGSIVIEGDAGKNVGLDMEGGSITIKGNARSIGRYRGGRIYHKGELIAGK